MEWINYEIPVYFILLFSILIILGIKLFNLLIKTIKNIWNKIYGILKRELNAVDAVIVKYDK